MKREEAIDKLMEKLGGKKVINLADVNQHVDFEEVGRSLNLQDELYSIVLETKGDNAHDLN